MIGDVRQRRMPPVEDTVKTGMSRLETVMSNSMLTIRRMPTRTKGLVFLSGVLSLCFYLYLMNWVYGSFSDGELESLLETEKCPVCFGGSACGLFHYKDLELSGRSKFRMLDMINGKNVHYATNRDGQTVILKKLATDSELSAMDKRLCEDAMRPEGCDIARVIVRTDMAKALIHDPLTPKLLKETGGFMFHCPSYRLLDRVWTYFKEYKKKKEVFTADKVHILYMALLNPEPLILQTFPKSEGWPFAKYIGACGRVVAEEYAGSPLGNFYKASFSTRAGLAHELLKIAETLSSKSDFSLYLTDVNYDNFAVDDAGKVTVVDAENIIVVDKLALEARKPSGWSEPHESPFSDCDGKNCLVFSSKDICNHAQSDHNYNAICRNLLSHYANEEGMPGGLLHDMPVEAEDYWDLRNLLEECARPRDKMGRWKAKDKLLDALAALKEQKADHLNTKAKFQREV